MKLWRLWMTTRDVVASCCYQVSLLTWGDLYMAHRTTGIPDITECAVLPRFVRLQIRPMSALRPLFKLSAVRTLAGLGVTRAPTPDECATTAHVWGKVEDEDGRFAAARLHGPEAAVVWTSGTAIAAVRRVIAGGGTAGFQTAALAFGPDFVFDVDGVVREDVTFPADMGQECGGQKKLASREDNPTAIRAKLSSPLQLNEGTDFVSADAATCWRTHEMTQEVDVSLRRLLLLSTLICAFLCPSGVDAATITLRTGVDGALTPLGENVTDPFWTISVQGGAFAPAEVVNSEVICCEMDEVGPQARWISDASVTDGSDNTGWGIGLTAIARRSFDMTGLNPATATLLGAWRVADHRRGVFLNGFLIPGTDSGAFGFQDDQLLSAGAASFLPGVNILEIRGTSVNSEFDAFWLDATVTADPIGGSVPEPATLLLLGAGALAAARRRLVKS
jgi:hypothetical protein